MRMHMFGIASKVTAKAKAAQPSGRSDAMLSGNVLLESLVCELHWAALQIGGITSILNSAHENELTSIPNSCRNHFPVEPQLIFAALNSWVDFRLPNALRARVERLYKELAGAKQCTEPHIGVAPSGRTTSIALQTIAQLTAIWRALSADACEAVNCMEPEVRWRVGGLYSENSLMLNRFLKDAIQGKHSCVDVFGEVVMPVLPQRRRAQRFALQQSCKIAVRGKIVQGFANDISMYGMGLSSDVAVVLREQIAIEIQTGRRFKGVVAWSNNGKVGVQFDTALARTDPLIFG
jgi:PilZ domain